MSDIGYLQVGGTEIIAPLRNTMSFINSNETHPHVSELRLKEVAAQSFGRYIEQFGSTENAVFQDADDIVALHAAIDGCRYDTPLAQMVHLVLHQGYKRGNHDTNAFHGEGRYLESNGLATSRRHQPQGVVSAAYRLDDFPLYPTEIIVAPVSFENLVIVAHFPTVEYLLSATAPHHVCKYSLRWYRRYRTSAST